MPSANTVPFKRMTDPLILPVSNSAQKFTVPAGFFTTGPGKGTVQFAVVNTYPFAVRLLGSTGTYMAADATKGWVFPPGYWGVLTTQYPEFMSTLGMNTTLWPYVEGAVGSFELIYGVGS